MMMTLMRLSTNVSMMMMRMERDIQCGFNLVLSRLADEDDHDYNDEDDHDYNDDDHDNYEYECEYDEDEDGIRHTMRIQFSPVKACR